MDIGAYESAIDTRPPQVVRVTPVSAVAGTSTCVFRVTYADDTALDFASIGTGDILVTGPHHFSQRAACISKVVFSPKLTTVTYRIKAPGGRWSVAGAGTYTITLQPGQVADMAGNRMTTQLLGTFKYGVKVKPLASNHFSSKLIIA